MSEADVSEVENMDDIFAGCGALTTIMTPKNLTCDASLTGTFVDENGNVYTSLPKNRPESITITKTTDLQSDWLKYFDYKIEGETIVLTGGMYGIETTMVGPGISESSMDSFVVAVISVSIRIIGEQFLPIAKLYRNRDKQWYVFGSANRDSLTLAQELGREENCVLIFQGENTGDAGSGNILCTDADIAALKDLREGDGRMTAIFMGEDPWENYCAGLAAAEKSIECYCMSDMMIDSVPDNMHLFGKAECLGRWYWQYHPLRMNGSDYLPDGITEEDGIAQAKYLEALGISCINVSCGTYDSGATIIEPSYFAEGWKINLAANIRKAVKIPVIAVCNVKHPAFAEKMLEEGAVVSKRRRKMFKDNLVQMRKMKQMTQEDIAEKVGVTRQAVAKWEAGETIPDLEKCRCLAEVFGVSLDDLANFEPKENMGLSVPPKGKHIFGVVTVGDKGQIVIPAKARKTFDITPGDQLVVLGDEAQGLAVIKAESFLSIAEEVKKLQKATPEV